MTAPRILVCNPLLFQCVHVSVQEIVVPLLKVLVHLHDHAWIHRDIKPENIFLTGEDRFKLGDFGLSINLENETPFEISGVLPLPVRGAAVNACALCHSDFNPVFKTAVQLASF